MTLFESVVAVGNIVVQVAEVVVVVGEFVVAVVEVDNMLQVHCCSKAAVVAVERSCLASKEEVVVELLAVAHN